MRILNTIGGQSVDCTDDNCDDAADCTRLTYLGNCVWEGQGPTNACITDGRIRLTLTCDGVNTTMTVEWWVDGTDKWTFQKTTASDPLDCSACVNHELDAVAPFDLKCGDQFNFARVNFQQHAGCCDTCPSQYQVTISGASDPDEGSPAGCSNVVCDNLNATYIVDFVGSNSTPTRSECGNWTDQTPWCEWKITGINNRCQVDTDHGFCEIHVYMQSRDDCQTEVIVELWEDFQADPNQCTSPEARLAWFTTFNGNCEVIDVTMGIANVCVDQLSICSPDAITVRLHTI